MVVYLEEEAVVGYTDFLAQVAAGAVENGPAPRVAIDYWKPHKDAQLQEAIIAVRADEAKHRHVNHSFAATLAKDSGQHGAGHPHAAQ